MFDKQDDASSVERYFNRYFNIRMSFTQLLITYRKNYLWGCRRNKELWNMRGCKFKAALKYKREKYICTKNNKLDIFKEKWER